MRTSSKVVKIAVVGQSGSGKTTCGKSVAKIVRMDFQKYKAVKLNVAQPLHKSQAYIYRTFGLPNSGQDGGLLQFLAGHFEKYLGRTFIKNLEKILDKHSRQKLVVINTDCRNNAYHYLKKAGFVFIKVEAGPETVAVRLGARGDIGLADTSHEVEWIDQIKPDYRVENNGSLTDLEGKLRELILKILRSQDPNERT